MWNANMGMQIGCIQTTQYNKEICVLLWIDSGKLQMLEKSFIAVKISFQNFKTTVFLEKLWNIVR